MAAKKRTDYRKMSKGKTNRDIFYIAGSSFAAKISHIRFLSRTFFKESSLPGDAAFINIKEVS